MALDNFKSLIDNLQAFDFGKEMQTIIEDNVGQLPDMIREQLAAGKSGNNEPSTIFGKPGYAKATFEIKNREGKGLGAVTDYVTNYMTGEFYQSIEVTTDGEVFEAESDVPYFDDIKAYSSDDLLEVDENHRRLFADTVTLPAIKEALFTKTGLQISDG